MGKEFFIDKKTENRLRYRAERLGLRLRKSKRRDRQARDYGCFALFDAVTGRALGGERPVVGAYHYAAEEIDPVLDAHALAAEQASAAKHENHEARALELSPALLPVQVEKVPALEQDSEEWRQWCVRRGFAMLGDGRRAYWGARSEYVINAGDYLVYDGGELINVASESDLVLAKKGRKENDG